MDFNDLVARLQRRQYGDSPAEILGTCKAAAALNATFLNARDRGECLQGFGIHRDTWGKLLAIARARFLWDPDIAGLLPASFSTIAALSRCSGEEFEEAKRQGLITPKLGQRRLEVWRRERDQQRSPAPLMRILPLAIAVAPDASENDELAIEVLISDKLKELSFQAELIRLKGWEDLEEQALRQWQKARIDEVRDELNQWITPAVIEESDLKKPLSELKENCSALTPEQWARVYALKNAQAALFSPDRQQRYASRSRWQKAAETDSYARGLYEQLIGNQQDSINDRNR